jgi:dipeptidyl aminopeptidase/acylaminoacyl peptidase
VQTVVALCAPEDFSAAFPTFVSTAIASLLGASRPPNDNAPEWKLYRAASPIQHVSADDAPMLLIHGDKDDIVPFEQSEKMEAALRQANVATKLIRVPGADHEMRPNTENVDFTSEMIRWFDTNCRRQ